MFRRLVLALILTTCPFLAQADIASDIRANVPAETVIANALAAGMNLEDIMDDIAQVVGSSEIGKFASAAVKVVALATGESESSAPLRRAVGYAIGMAASQQYGGTGQGELYASSATSFRPVSSSQITNTTGTTISLADITPAGALPGALAGRTGGTGPLGLSQGATSGGGGGTALEDAVCEALGSEPGCASGIL